MATVACTKAQPILCRPVTDDAFGMTEEIALFVLRRITDQERHRLAGGVQLRLRNLPTESRTTFSTSFPSSVAFCVANS